MDLLFFYLIFWMSACSAIAIAGLIALWVGIKGRAKSSSIIGVVLVIIAFIGFGFIGSARFGPKGVTDISGATGESSLLTLIKEVSSQPLSSADIDKISKSNVTGSKEWIRLLLYRIEIRKTLRRMANANSNNELKPDKSLTHWINEVAAKKLLTQAQVDALCKVRDDSHYFEWQEGSVPTQKTLEDLSVNEPRILDELLRNASVAKPALGDAPQPCPDFERTP